MEIFDVAAMRMMFSITNSSTEDDDTAGEILKLLGGWSQSADKTDQ
jgi:hypothetical protein